MAEDTSFLGRGWSFPPSFNQIHKEVSMVTAEDDINQSLKILLGTKPGERVMNPDFGCDLLQFVFEEITESLFSHIKTVITDAIIRFEARIEVEEIEVEHDDSAKLGVLYITIHYIIRQTNSRHNMVYPFYLLEGNNITTV